MASAVCSPPPTPTAQHQVETPDVLLRRLKVLEVEDPPELALPRLSWEEDPVTWLVHELLYCCQAREQQKFDATYEDVRAMLHKFLKQNQMLETGPVSAATRQAEFAKMLASLIKRISLRGQLQAVNDFLQSKLEHVVAVLAPHATARPVADLLEAMAQGTSSFRLEHDQEATMTVLPCVVRFARALIRSINEGFNGAVSRPEETFHAQCQLLATTFSTLKDGMRVLLDAHHAPRETLEAMRRAPELPSRLSPPARAQLFKRLLHESSPALLLAAMKLEACGDLVYLPSILVDVLRHGTRFAAANIYCLQRALKRPGHEEARQQAESLGPTAGSCGLLHLSKLLAVLRAALHLQQVCDCPSVQWQRLEQLLLHEVQDSAGVSSGNLCSLLWEFARYRSQSSMVMQHATYVLKTCVAQAERLPRVLRQTVVDQQMLEVTAGILRAKLASADPAEALSQGLADEGLADLAAFCEGMLPCFLENGAAISKVAPGNEVEVTLVALKDIQKSLSDSRVPWQFDLKSITSKNHCIAKTVLATLKDSPMVSGQDKVKASELPSRSGSAQPPREADRQGQADGPRCETPGAGQPARTYSHSRSSSCDDQPAGSRKPGRSRGSERPPAGPPSPFPGRPSSSSLRRSLERQSFDRQSLDRTANVGRAGLGLERSRSTSSLTSRSQASPAPPRPSGSRALDKDSKGKAQISIRVDAHGQRELLPAAPSASGRETERHRRSKSELSLMDLQHGRHVRSLSQPLSSEALSAAAASSDAGHLLSTFKGKALR
ncbi:hypothetical protein WJX84_002123 [Apatococcus fuscideae]|uniref:Uncharacterized protein n=1 Tax=Apatococcus fuscideae TaxID=2026836 RepID=A0AAW1T7X3_9CHLO